MSHTLIHKHSADIIESGIPKVPNINQIYHGEIAVNYADGAETLIIKNNIDEIVEFKSKKYVDNEINGLSNIYAPKAEFEEVQKKVNEITSVGGEPNVQSDWNVVDESSDAFIKNKPNLSVYATQTALDNTNTRLNALENISGQSHTHSNKTLLDSYTQTEANLADAVSKKHSHENKAVLDGITADKVNAWDNTEQNAKKYTDGRETAIHTWVEEKKYLTEHQDISHLASKTEVLQAEGRASAYINAEIAKLSDVYAEKATVNTLVGEDTNKSIRNIAAEEVVKIVSGAPESYDTLKEIADWILNDTTGAASMANDISELKAVSADTRLDALENISGQTHSHSNKALLDTYTQTEANLKDAVTNKHSHSNKTVLDGITSTKVSNWDSAATNKHSHSNKSLLDTYAQTETNLADAVSKKHAHENKAVLDGITADKVNAWDSVKGYFEEIIEENELVVVNALNAIKESVGLEDDGSLDLSGETSIKDILISTSSAIEELSGLTHSHSNKTVLDGITSTKVSNWDNAEQNAKNYADTIANTVSDSNEVIAHAINAIKESIGLNENGEFVWNNVTTSIKNVLTLISAVTKSYPTTYIWEWDETDTGSITAEDYDAMAAATIFILNPLGAIATSKLNLGGDLMITFTIPFITDGTINMNLVVNRQNLTYQMITEQVVIPTSISQLSNDRNYITSEDLNDIIDTAITSKLNTEI